MTKSTQIELVEPFPWFDKLVNRVVLKAPTGFNYMNLGEPRFIVRMADGASYFVEKDEVVAAYIRELLSFSDDQNIDGGELVLRAMSLADVLQIKEALFSFFTDAASAISRKRSTISSSGSASSPQTPATA
ncbi:hypothetical protein [Methylocapsa acidiphila]|uniref:hypothetical protein n=1 Tax=Methylocapsa acidiphila TaxID=133552 RepID=UPI0003FD5E00|nr:hypothetical protein [Methylocapsa acidiphila]